MRRVAARLAGAAAALLSCAPGAAADWSGFYAPSDTPGPVTLHDRAPAGCAAQVPALSAVPALGEAPASGTGCPSGPTSAEPAGLAVHAPTTASAETACVSAILGAQSRYAIPDNLLMGIGLQEAGIARGDGITVWPWSVNVEGEGRFLRDFSEAISWVQTRQGEGADLIDVGCMQINLRWHPDAFASLEEAFDPDRNVDYAARYLLRMRERTGDWRAAVGRYHSADPDRAASYLVGVETNLRVIGTRVPDATAQAGPAGTPPFEGDLDAFLNALVSDEPADATRPLWSAGLGADRGEGAPVYGLYGPAGRRPVLPAFQRNF
jgi:hypothetical protein